MKTRYGFVSNSSTTSFCIYGTTIKSDTMPEGMSIYKLKQIATKKGYSLEVHSTEFDEFIGRSYCDIKDDETGLQFKERVEKEASELLKANGVEFDKSFTIIDRAYYNG